MESKVIKLYEGRDDVTLTTYILADSPEMLNGKPRPAILICPGGAYFTCSDREGEPVALAFAAMGYHAFVLRYSVYGEDFFGKRFENIKPIKENCHPTPMREIGQAMLIIKAHAEEWHVDPDRVAVCGFSAGAHNCAMYAANWHQPVITSYFSRDKEIFRPAACILGYCLSDYVFMNERPNENPMDKAFFSASNTVFLGTPTPSQELLEEVSPARNVTENMPPTFLWATAADDLVPVQHSLRMAHALADHHIPFEIHVFEEGMHGLATASQSAAAAKSQIHPDVAEWVGLAETWLRKRFSFDLPQLTPFEESLANGSLPQMG